MKNIEVEIKSRVNNPVVLIQEILKRGAVFKDEKYQHDILLDPPHKDFAKSDQVLRIRNVNGTWKLDYKSARFDKETQSRRELSLKIEDGKQLRDVFMLMDFKVVGEIEKKRKTYVLGAIGIA